LDRLHRCFQTAQRVLDSLCQLLSPIGQALVENLIRDAYAPPPAPAALSPEEEAAVKTYEARCAAAMEDLIAAFPKKASDAPQGVVSISGNASPELKAQLEALLKSMGSALAAEGAAAAPVDEGSVLA
jgi:hypothetical protein